MSSLLEEPRTAPARRAPTPHPRQESAVDPEFMLWEAIQFLGRHWKVIVGTGLAAALVAGLVLHFVIGDQYEAVAVLIVAPSKFSSSLKAETLDIRGHQRLLESDAVIADTVRRLVDAELVDDPEDLRIGGALQSRIPVVVPGARGQGGTDSPLIEVVALASSAETAAETANTWAAVFVEHSRKLVAESTAPTIELAETEYQRRRTEIEALANQRTELSNEYQTRLDEAEMRWLRAIDAAAGRKDGDLVAAKNETEEIIARFQNETRQVFESYAEEQGFSSRATRPAEPPSAEGFAEAAADEAADTDAKGQLRRLASLRSQLAQTPPVLQLEKAISDEALWQTEALREFGATDVESLTERTNLLTQEINPVSTELSLQISRIEAALGDEQALTIASQLESMQRERSAGLAAITANRALGFDRIQSGRRLTLAELAAKKRQEIEALSRERADRLKRIDQDLESKTTTFKMVSGNYEQALLATADSELVDIRLSWPAAPPVSAVSKQLAEKALVAAVVGLVLGLILALVLEGRAATARRATAG